MLPCALAPHQSSCVLVVDDKSVQPPHTRSNLLPPTINITGDCLIRLFSGTPPGVESSEKLVRVFYALFPIPRYVDAGYDYPARMSMLPWPTPTFKLLAALNTD
jgi:hypothetical protein